MSGLLADAAVADAADNTLVVYTVVATACLSVVVLAFARLVGPLGEALQSAAERRRAYRQRAEDARILDLSQQVDHLGGRVWTLEQARERQSVALIAHAVWDQALISRAIEAGLEVTPPPPLYPPPD